MESLDKFGVQKSFEIAYAVFRIISRIEERPLSRHLEEKALDLLSAISSRDYSRGAYVLHNLGRLLQLGVEAGSINTLNASTILGEMKKFEEYLSGQRKSGVGSAAQTGVSLKGIFSDWSDGVFRGGDGEASSSQDDQQDNSEKGAINLEHIKGSNSELSGNGRRMNITDVTSVRSGGISPEKSGNLAIALDVTGSERQAVILGKVRQSGYCRLKDIQEILPDVSERTIRYDLQKLGSQGLIEKIGNGGPSTYYRLKRTASS